MSDVPEWHAKRLAPYISDDETVKAACVELPPEGPGSPSRTTAATDARLIRLSVEEESQVVTSIPYSQVTTAQVTVTDDEKPDFNAIVSGALATLVGLGGIVHLGFDLDGLASQVVFFLFFACIGIGIYALADAFDTEKGRVRLKLTGVDGDTVLSATLPKSQTDFTQTVSRLVGKTHRDP